MGDDSDEAQRLKFYGRSDLGTYWQAEPLLAVLTGFDPSNPVDGIGDIVELTNAALFVEHDLFSPDVAQPDRERFRALVPEIRRVEGIFFNSLSDATFGAAVSGIPFNYRDDVLTLAARLDDEEGDTRFEAAGGLARRGDPRALAAIAGRLEDESATIYLLDLDGAAELADPVLLPALERLQIKWTGDDDAHTVAVSYAIARCEPATHDLAKRVEPQFVDAVNRALVDVGWTITSNGEYPLTVLTVRRPDGSLANNYDFTLLWDGVSPTEFNFAQEVTSTSATIRGMAAEEPQMSPVTDEDSA